MDKNAIKKYAVWARRELISRVSQKALQYGISEKEIVPTSAASVNGVVLSAEEIKQRKALIEQINAKGYEQVMEEVAYTWFNRFIALRFMEVNGYLPSHVRVFTDEDNAFKPQIITEAINLELDGLNMDKVYAWKDTNDNDSLFKYLIITQCNALSPILPRMFQRIADYTELLFPDNLLREGSAIQQMIELIPEDDWKDAVQIIGWLYQYYNSEKKDEVFAALKKNVKITKENIPAATQLFTPDWIVRYMVENSLGRLWIEGHPNDSLKAQWKYYLDEAEQEPEVQAQLTAIRKEYASMAPEQIKCIDPCAGSGHILVYMFDVLVQIYEDYGYSAREAVRSIVENNLYGLDIDERAAQLAYFAVMMKARQYDRRFFARKNESGNPDVPQPHIFAIVESNSIDRFALDYFINGDVELKRAMNCIINDMDIAKEYGSITKVNGVNFAALHARIAEIQEDINLSRDTVLNDIVPLIQVAELLHQKYHIVITNPPYMGIRNMEDRLAGYLSDAFPNTKYDLFSVFMERCQEMTKPQAFFSLITQNSWMFINSFQELRETLLSTTSMSSMCHLGFGAFGADFGTTAFCVRKAIIPNYLAKYVRLGDYRNIEDKEVQYFDVDNLYSAKQEMYHGIPRKPFAYWITQNSLKAFASNPPLGEVSTPRQGMATSDNKRFVRFWPEVEATKIGFGHPNAESAQKSKKKWFPYNNGGDFRKWYGNNLDVVNYENDGYEVKEYAASLYKSYSRTIKSISQYFLSGGTWNAITSTSSLSVRFFEEGYVFSNAGMAIFPERKAYPIKYIIGFLNSKVVDLFLKYLSPTLNFNQGDIAQLPIKSERVSEIEHYSDRCIFLSRDDWNSFETSWNFDEHPLIRLSKDLWDATAVGASMHYYYGSHPKVSGPLELCYLLWQGECQERFRQLKENEEELNRIFIDIYGLQDELTPDVEDEDVTVRLADKKRDIKSLISYAVGCMFGRYSLDVPGLAYAGGEWDDSKYTTFKADKDSIIPICDDEYFADDIVGRFIRFIEVVYGEDTLQENLRFIADALGGSGQPKDIIRNYFLNDFYADHLKVYQKRPIYWLFDSGKKNGFKALVYMHRYAPDTIARMRTDYVHEQQARYRTAIADIEQRIASASTAERVKLSKRLKTLQEQAAEIQGYEEKIHHLADQYIAIDLDDGVKKNYAIFEDVLAKIK